MSVRMSHFFVTQPFFYNVKCLITEYPVMKYSWVNCHQIENFQCINISPGREKFETHLGFILSPLKG